MNQNRFPDFKAMTLRGTRLLGLIVALFFLNGMAASFLVWRHYDALTTDLV